MIFIDSVSTDTDPTLSRNTGLDNAKEVSFLGQDDNSGVAQLQNGHLTQNYQSHRQYENNNGYNGPVPRRVRIGASRKLKL